MEGYLVNHLEGVEMVVVDTMEGKEIDSLVKRLPIPYTQEHIHLARAAMVTME